jgi:hypothetical protein
MEILLCCCAAVRFRIAIQVIPTVEGELVVLLLELQDMVRRRLLCVRLIWYELTMLELAGIAACTYKHSLGRP